MFELGSYAFVCLRSNIGGALSLAAMVNLSLGTQNAFLKDKETTTSSWGAEHLSIRQLVYAALDAQTSWVAGANQMQIPKPFNVSDIPHALLSKFARWKQRLRAHSMDAEAHAQSASSALSGVVRNNMPALPSADQLLLEATHRLIARTMQSEEPFHPFVHALLSVAFPTQGAAAHAMPTPGVKLPGDASGSVASSAAAMPSTSWYESEDLVVETMSVHGWFAPMQPNRDLSYLEQPFWQRLLPSQQEAIEAAETTRVHFIFGRQYTARRIAFTSACRTCSC